jgi:HD-like signal output (HDOD) protein
MSKIEETEQMILNGSIDSLVQSVAIPPCPSLLLNLERELNNENSNFNKISSIITYDVALSASLLKVVNSTFYGFQHKIETVEHAINVLGMNQLSSLVLGLMARKVFSNSKISLTRFWDVSAKRSFAMKELARTFKYPNINEAQSFGLFCDIGIPVLLQKFPNYMEILKKANAEKEKPFITIEDEAINTDHTLLGAIMAKSWGLSNTICNTIKLHHDYSIFTDPNIPENIQKLVAMNLVAEYAISQFSHLNESCEWNKAGEYALGKLAMSDDDLVDWSYRLGSCFSHGIN